MKTHNYYAQSLIFDLDYPTPNEHFVINAFLASIPLAYKIKFNRPNIIMQQIVEWYSTA